jgi:hypothetical protein
MKLLFDQNLSHKLAAPLAVEFVNRAFQIYPRLARALKRGRPAKAHP